MTNALKLTPERWERICAHLERGEFFTTACRLERVSPDTARKSLPDKPDIAERVEQAKARGEQRLRRAGNRAAKEGRGTGWYQFQLEKRFPKRWGKQAVQRVEQTGKDGGAQEIKLTIAQAHELAKDGDE